MNKGKPMGIVYPPSYQEFLITRVIRTFVLSGKSFFEPSVFFRDDLSKHLIPLAADALTAARYAERPVPTFLIIIWIYYILFSNKRR